MVARIFKGLRLSQNGIDAVAERAKGEGVSWSEAARRSLMVGVLEWQRQQRRGPK